MNGLVNMISRDISMKSGSVGIKSCCCKCRVSQISKLNEEKKYLDKINFLKITIAEKLSRKYNS